MKAELDESRPIFQQIAEIITNEIVEGNLNEEEQIPSENDLSAFYNINRATIRKGLQFLVEKNIIYKQRGVGMFVREGAREKLLKDRKSKFNDEYICPLLNEAARIGIDTEAIIKIIKKTEQE